MKKIVKTLTNKVLRKLGVALIPRWRLDDFLLENRTKRIILEYEIDCFFDVGANVGQYRDFLRHQVGYDGRIVSFEPDPKCYSDLLNRKRDDDRWDIFNIALGKEVGVLDFNIMKTSVMNSFLSPDDSKTKMFSEQNAVAKVIHVEVARLDGIIEKITASGGIENAFLKMDTQGFDLEVFAGAAGCLERIKAIQTEVSVLPIYKGMPSIDDSIKTFRSAGFEVSGIYSISEHRFPHAVEFDCIYVK